MIVSTASELLAALEMSKDIELTNDIDLTGHNSILVTSKIDLNKFTIFANELFDGSDLFLFLLQGGVIGNGKIIGANGNLWGEEGKYFGAIRSTQGSVWIE